VPAAIPQGVVCLTMAHAVTAASRLVARLLGAGLVVQTRTDAKRVFYWPAGQVLVVLGLAGGATDA
jgi:hypothetical protein